MKKYLYIVLSLVCLASFNACSDDELVGTHNLDNSITITKQDVCFEAQGGQGTITFSAPGAATATSSADWCHASVSGSTVNVSVDANTLYEGRNAVITIACGSDSRQVSVVQNGVQIWFTYEDQTVEVSSKGGTYTVGGTSTDDCTVMPSVDWITCSRDADGIVTINVAKNDNYQARTGKVAIYAPDHDNMAVITIKQAERTLPNADGTYTITYQDNKGNVTTGKVTLTQDETDANTFYLKGLSDFVITMYRDTENERFYIKNNSYIGTYTESSTTYYCAATINYTDAATQSKNYYSANQTSNSYWIYFSYSIDEKDKYTIKMVDLINSVSKGSYYML